LPVELFPFLQYWWLYLAFSGLVLVLVALDLGVVHRNPHAITLKEATIASIGWILLALLYNLGFYYYCLWLFPNDPRLMAVPGFQPAVAAKQAGLEFLAGYIIERALSIDNIFVFVVVFQYFGIPARLQHRVLYYGIIGAFVFRAIFIALGALLMQYQWVVWFFGALLVYTGIKMAVADEMTVDPEKNVILKLFKKMMPVSTQMDGHHFFVRQAGKWLATPLFVALLFLEVTDVVFAIDSVPAIFALTKEPLIVFTSNIFAILGLRAMYFMLAGAMDLFHLLKYGLSVVLVFVGLKMLWLNQMFGGHFPIGVSLGIILGVLVVSIGASLVFPAKAKH
jgi:tellurite resistance protein TerC